jgi:hypothetical protein
MCKAVAMRHIRYPATVLWTGYSGNHVHTYSIERIAVPVLVESCEKAEQTALSTRGPQIKCIWTDGPRDNLGNVSAAVAWKEGAKWTGLKYRLGRNKEVFDAELFTLS